MSISFQLSRPGRASLTTTEPWRALVQVSLVSRPGFSKDYAQASTGLIVARSMAALVKTSQDWSNWCTEVLKSRLLRKSIDPSPHNATKVPTMPTQHPIHANLALVAPLLRTLSALQIIYQGSSFPKVKEMNICQISGRSSPSSIANLHVPGHNVLHLPRAKSSSPLSNFISLLTT